MLWQRNPLTSSRLSWLGRKRRPRQFFPRYVKERFRGLDIQITIIKFQVKTETKPPEFELSDQPLNLWAADK
jgi:hypothetical protein